MGIVENAAAAVVEPAEEHKNHPQGHECGVGHANDQFYRRIIIFLPQPIEQSYMVLAGNVFDNIHQQNDFRFRQGKGYRGGEIVIDRQVTHRWGFAEVVVYDGNLAALVFGQVIGHPGVAPAEVQHLGTDRH